MKATLLGTGTPKPNAARNCSATLIQSGSSNIVVDAGRGVTQQLTRAGVDPKDIDYTFLTHHHFDHIGNLDDLLLAGWVTGRTSPVRIFGPQGTREIVDTMLHKTYARDIKFRMDEAALLGVDLTSIVDLVIVTEISRGDKVQVAGTSVTCEDVDHGHGLGMLREDWPCLGFRFAAAGKVVTISGDTVDCDGVRVLAKDADLLIQCCYMAEAAIDTDLKRALADHVLASAGDANRIARAANPKKMVLTHLAAFQSEDMLALAVSEAGEGIETEVVLGADLMTVEV